MIRPSINHVVIAAGVMLALVGIGHWSRSCVAQRVASEALTQSTQKHEQAISHAAQGALHDQQADAKAPALQADSYEVQRLRAEVARLRKAPPAPAPPAPSLGLPEPEPASLPVDLAPLVATLDELNGVLTKENADLKTALAERTAAATSWKAAYLASADETRLLKIAHEAQMSAIKAERWKGRIEGLAVGLGAGYLGGRLR